MEQPATPKPERSGGGKPRHTSPPPKLFSASPKKSKKKPPVPASQGSFDDLQKPPPSSSPPTFSESSPNTLVEKAVEKEKRENIASICHPSTLTGVAMGLPSTGVAMGLPHLFENGVSGKKSDSNTESQNLPAHSFSITTLKKPTWCCVCKEFIWGLMFQAHECAHCHMVCHHRCLSIAQTLECSAVSQRNSVRFSVYKKPSISSPSLSPTSAPHPSLPKEKVALLFEAAQSKTKKHFTSVLSQCAPSQQHTQTLVHEINGQGLTLLHVACQSGSLPVVEFLYKKVPILLQKCDPLSWTPLHFACHAGHLEISHFLLTNGADPIDTGDGSSPLHLLASHSTIGESQPALYLQIILLLLKTRPTIVNAQNDQGESALHIAAMSGSHKTILYLSKFGGNICIQLRSLRGETALSYAVRTKSKVILSLLLEMGGDPLECTTCDGSCRDIASKTGNNDALEIIDEFVEQKESSGDLMECLMKEASKLSRRDRGTTVGNRNYPLNLEERIQEWEKNPSPQKESKKPRKGKRKTSFKEPAPVNPEITPSPPSDHPPQFASLASFNALQNLPSSSLGAVLASVKAQQSDLSSTPPLSPEEEESPTLYISSMQLVRSTNLLSPCSSSCRLTASTSRSSIAVSSPSSPHQETSPGRTSFFDFSPPHKRDDDRDDEDNHDEERQGDTKRHLQWSFRSPPVKSENNDALGSDSTGVAQQERSVGKHRDPDSYYFARKRSKSWCSLKEDGNQEKKTGLSISEQFAKGKISLQEKTARESVVEKGGERGKPKISSSLRVRGRQQLMGEKKSPTDGEQKKSEQQKEKRTSSFGGSSCSLYRSKSAPSLTKPTHHAEKVLSIPLSVKRRKLQSNRNILALTEAPEIEDKDTDHSNDHIIACFLELKNELIKGMMVMSKEALTFIPAGYTRPVLIYSLPKITSIVSCNSSLVVPDSIAVSTRTRNTFFRGVENRDEELEELSKRWKASTPLTKQSVTLLDMSETIRQLPLRKEAPALSPKGGEEKKRESPRTVGNPQAVSQSSSKMRIKRSESSRKPPTPKGAGMGGDSGGKGESPVLISQGASKMRIRRSENPRRVSRAVTQPEEEQEQKMDKVWDNYGFVVPKGFEEMYLERQQKEKEGANLTKGHWAKLMSGECDLVEEKLHRKKLKKLIDEGVYPPVRPKLWSYLADLKLVQSQSHEGFYLVLAQESELSSVTASQITKDVLRTFPEHTYFQTESGKQALHRVLAAFSNYNPQLGYCQAMNFIAGVLLVVLKDEEQVFWALVSLINNYLNEYFSRSLIGSLVDNKVFEVLLSETQPKLYAHLQHLGYPLGIITTKWFMCLFAEASLPTETLLRIWDSFFLHGVDQLIYTGLTIFRVFEKGMMKCQDPEDVRNILREQPSSLFDADKFMKVCKQTKSSIKMASIQKLRKKIYDEISADLHSFSSGRE